MRPGTHRVFTYETLRSPSEVSKVVGHNIPFEPAEAIGERKVPRDVDGTIYFTLVSDKDHKTAGHVMTVDAAELRKLDAWEDKYERMVVKLADNRPAWVYVLKETKDSLK